MFGAGAAMLLEREKELEALASTIAGACDGEGGLLLVEGDAGCGKSELVIAADDLARESGAFALVAHASELERDHPFGVVVQLLSPALAAFSAEERAELVDGPARLAAPLFPSLRTGAGAEAADAFALVHGVYWLISRISARVPLLLAIDDVQWVDERSLQVLRYVAARISDLPVAMVVAGRDAPLDVLARADEPIRLRLRPLTPEGVAELAIVEFPAADLGFCAAAHEATAGVPMLVRELFAAVRTQGLEPTARTIAALDEVTLERVARAVLERLATLPPGADVLARVAAVLDTGTELRHAAHLAELDEHRAAAAYEALTAAGIVEADELVRLRHPIVRCALEASVAPVQRARLHLAVAQLLLGEAAPPERVAGHLLHAERRGRRWVSETLRRAASKAMARGAPASAARYLDRALSEPAPEDAHAEILLELARAEAAAGTATAPARIRAALEPVTGDADRARTLADLAQELPGAAGADAAGASAGAAAGGAGGAVGGAPSLGDRAALVAAFEDGLLASRNHTADPEATRWLEATLLAEARDEPALRKRALRLLGTAGETDTSTASGRSLAAQRALEAALAGRPADQVRAVAEAALGRGALLTEDRPGGPHLLAALRALMLAGDLQSAELGLAVAVERARESASPAAYARVCALRADVALRRGSLADADADARAALDASGDPPPEAAATLALALTEHGDHAGAEEALARATPGGSAAALDEPGTLPPAAAAALLHARAVLRLATGDRAAAHADAVRAAERLWELGIDPPAVLPWRTTAALALHPEDPDAAQMLAARQVDLARQAGAALGYGSALRVAGVVEGGPHGLALLEEAVRVLADVPATLERAKALAALAEALRGAGRRVESRSLLREALGLAQRTGAAALEARVDAALAAVGERHRRTDPAETAALSPVERRVVDLATDGLSADEIARALFLTDRAVEWHLRAATRKLGARTRAQLLDSMTRG